MPVIDCASCGRQLKLPDNAGGRKFKCPQCGGLFLVQQTSAAPAPLAAPRPEPEEEVVLVETDLDAETAPPQPRPRKRKKKKRYRAPERTEGAVPKWVWWWCGLVGACLLTVAGFIGMAWAGYPKMAIAVSLLVILNLPVRTFVFAVSILISNYFGIMELVDFGTLIPKALILVLIVSLVVSFMPCCGGLMSLAILMLGAMGFFGLDVWESRMLVMINWALGWLIMWALTMAVMAPK
jgi:hypothetical protein